MVRCGKVWCGVGRRGVLCGVVYHVLFYCVVLLCRAMLCCVVSWFVVVACGVAFCVAVLLVLCCVVLHFVLCCIVLCFGCGEFCCDE